MSLNESRVLHFPIKDSEKEERGSVMFEIRKEKN